MHVLTMPAYTAKYIRMPGKNKNLKSAIIIEPAFLSYTIDALMVKYLLLKLKKSLK